MLKLLQNQPFQDHRGLNFEVHRDEWFPVPMVQTSLSRSFKNVVRGLHYQLERPQAKLVSVVRGAIYDVVVDVRRSSETFGKWIAYELSEENRNQLFIPYGYAHGFCALTEVADVLYHLSDYFAPGTEGGVLWNDPTLGIEWPVQDPIVSQKDASFRPLAEIPPDRLFP